MRFSEYLATLTADEQRSLTVDLTLGCGRVALAERLHRRAARTGTLLGAVAVAHTSMCAARATLDPDGWTDTASPALVGCADALPLRWAALIGGHDQEVVTAYLQIAAEAAHDVVTETAANADITAVRACLQAAVEALATVRDGALSHT